MSQATLERVDWAKVGLWGPPAPRRTWGPRDVTYGVLWLIGANILLAVPVVAFMLLGDPEAITPDIATQPAVLTGGLLTLWLVFAGVPLAVSRRFGLRSLKDDFGWVAPTMSDWALGLKLGVVMRVADIAIGWVAGTVGWTTGDNSDWLFAPRALILTAFFVVGAAVIAPALEELFFRGFIMRALARTRRLTGRAQVIVPIVVSSLIFGTLHATALDVSGLYVVLVTATAGAVLAVVAVRRGNLGASITAHIVFNSTGVIGAWAMTN